MANQLAPISINAPGSYGLNSQEGVEVLSPAWCTNADNCVIGESGNLESRKGYEQWNPNPNGAADDFTRVWEFITGIGNSKIFAATSSDVYLYQDSVTSPTSTKASTSVDDTWEFVNFNDKFLGFSPDFDPVVMGTTTFSDITIGSGTFPRGNIALVAAGRCWVVQAANGNVLKFSSLQDETKWNPADGGGAISFTNIWEKGTDRITAVAEFQNKLIVFGRKHVIILDGIQDPTDATVFGVVDQIVGVGCINRRCVQNIGTDLLFLSDSGIRSLSRTVLTTTHPLQDISRNVRSSLVDSIIDNSTFSFYNEGEGIVVFYQPNTPVGYCVNLKGRTPNDDYPITRWDSTEINDAFTTRAGLTLFTSGAAASSIYVNKYSGYEDGPSTSINFTYKSAWFLLSETSEIVIPKDFVVTYFTTGTPSVTYGLAYDFSDTFLTLPETAVVDGWNIKRVAALGQGLYLRLSIEAEENNESIRLRNLIIHLQPGSLY